SGGRVPAKRPTKTTSTAPNPPGESAITASQIRPAIVSPTLRKTSTGRHVDRAAGAAIPTSSRGERSSMEGLCVSFPAFEDIAVCVQVQCGGRRDACYPLLFVPHGGPAGGASGGNDNRGHGQEAGRGRLVARA